MTSHLSVFCAFLLILQSGSQQSSAPAQQDTTPVKPLVSACQQPCLEDGTPVRLRISQTISSEEAHVNDRVEFEVLEDVKVGETLIIPKGGIAWATVTEAQPKRRMARGGKLEIVMDSVRLADGEKAALRATKEVKGGGHTGAMTAGIVATGLIFLPAAPFFLFMHGKEVTIPKGTEVPTFVDGNFTLDLAKFQKGAASTVAQEVAPSPTAGAEIAVNSTPTGADIEVDGAFVGSTPSSVGVSPGDHVITIAKKGYVRWEKKIKVTTGKIEISAELETAPDTQKEPVEAAPQAPAQGAVTGGAQEDVGSVSVTSDPSGADVYADDSRVGNAPITFTLKPGQHYVRVFMKGYNNWSQQVIVSAGSTAQLAAALTKPD
jgi:hypothetical protein